jgi:hypothetical protein
MEEVVINNLLFEARSQTLEIAADVLITIAESGTGRKVDLRRRILEEGFALASQAQYPAKRFGTPGALIRRSLFATTPYSSNLTKYHYKHALSERF